MAMKKKGAAKGGVRKMKPGGKLNMVKNKAGKMVPDFAADGVGKSAAGGRVAKKMVLVVLVMVLVVVLVMVLVVVFLLL